MNRVFDYNGSHVSPSKPVKALKTIKKHLMVDSVDRDTTKFFTNGDFVVYLPRVYENVVSMRLMAAEFPVMVTSAGSAGAVTHSVSDGANLSKAVWSGDNAITTTPFYLLVDIEGFNKTDECAINGNRSGFSNGYYAKIPVGQFGTTQYNDHSAQENVAHLTPAIGKLDRLHIRTRLHEQQGSTEGFVYWTKAGSSVDNQKGADFSLSFEIEYLDNVFDDFSSIETRVSDRG